MNPAQDKPTIVNNLDLPTIGPTLPVSPLPAADASMPPIQHSNSETARRIKKVLLALIPASIVIFVIVLISFLISQYRKAPAPVVENTPSPTLIPTTPAPTPVENPYKDWKAYINRSAQISFKYPPNVKLNEESSGTNKTIISLTHEQDGSVAIGQFISVANTDPASILKSYVTSGGAIDSTTEQDFTISGLSGKQGQYTLAQGGEGIPVNYVYVTRDTTTFVFSNPVLSEKDLFFKILDTVRFVSKGVTDEWGSYSNSSGSFSLQYPPNWILDSEETGVATGSAHIVSIRKSAVDREFQNLTIQSSAVSGKQSVQLSASDLISSLQNLSGWANTPTLDFRNFGIAQAQIISGVKDGAWQEYGVIWFRNTLVQLSWKDTQLRQEQDTFDDILSTLKFI